MIKNKNSKNKNSPKNKNSKKGAMELSINTIVIIIISLVILGSGITLLYKFIGGAEQLKGQLDEQTNAELERLLVDQGKQVALPLHLAEVERGDSHVFGLGILNTNSALEKFRIEIELSKVVNAQEEDITQPAREKDDPHTWLLYNDEELGIEDGQHYKEQIVVNVPEDALTGQYIFNAKVYSNDNQQYGNTQKFYVNVK